MNMNQVQELKLEVEQIKQTELPYVTNSAEKKYWVTEIHCLNNEIKLEEKYAGLIVLNNGSL